MLIIFFEKYTPLPGGKGYIFRATSLPSCPSLFLDNLLYREDFLWSAHGRRDLSSCEVYKPKSWRLEGVRIWKLSRTYPGEKPPSLSVLTHGCSLVKRKPTRHLLTMPYILVRIGAPYEGGCPFSSTCPGTWHHL